MKSPHPAIKIEFNRKELTQNIYSASWAIVDGGTSQLLVGYKHNEKRELASCTKIITLYVVSQLTKRFEINQK